MMDTEVLIGTMDWRGPGWQSGYYPPDMPEDWQLGFYANEFDTTVLDTADLLADNDLYGQWQDCRAGFLPVLKIGSKLRTDNGRLEKLLQAVSSSIAGLWIDCQGDATATRDLIELCWRSSAACPIALSGNEVQTGRSGDDAPSVYPLCHLSATGGIDCDSWLVEVNLDMPPRQLALRSGELLSGLGAHERVCLLASGKQAGPSDIEHYVELVGLLGY